MEEESHTLFFFNDTATTEIYTLSLHDALPILVIFGAGAGMPYFSTDTVAAQRALEIECQVLLMGKDRKSTRLNSSHANISYAVFCLKKKQNIPSIPFFLSVLFIFLLLLTHTRF